MTFKIDHDGMKAVLNSGEAQSAVRALAQEIAGQVEAQGITVSSAGVPIPVKVDDFKTDRVGASVTLAHPAGTAVQIKHGALTRAAAAVGLEVKSK